MEDTMQKRGRMINFTNHPSVTWSKEQIDAAHKYGEIIDIPFPQVGALATKKEIRELAKQCLEQIVQAQPTVVLCQGEFTLAYQIIHKLQELGISVIAACSERRVTEKYIDGKFTKCVEFHFACFREYE